MYRLLPLIFAIGALAADIPVSDFLGKGWSFSLGQEFPGAKGDLSFGHTHPSGAPALHMHADFSAGGAYVDTGIKLPRTPVERLNFAIKAPGLSVLTMRIIDSADTCHQIKIPLNGDDQWQDIRFPLRRFFENRGQPAGFPVLKYEYWGPKKTDGWNGPARALHLLIAKPDPGPKTFNLHLSQLSLTPRPAAELVRVTQRLDDAIAHAKVVDWAFNLGQEFKGAQGQLELLADRPGMRMSADFSEGGGYVSAGQSLRALDAKRLDALHLQLRARGLKQLVVRLVDDSGQCFQKRFPLADSADWQNLTLRPRDFLGSERWGGAKDGRWHGPPSYVAFLISKSHTTSPQAGLDLADIRAEITRQIEPAPPAFEGQAMRLARSLEDRGIPTSQDGARFEASPGRWRVSGRAKSAIHSPDNSYNGSLSIAFFAADKSLLRRAEVHVQTTGGAWKPFSTSVDAPHGTVRAQLQATLNKTWGSVEFDSLSASYLASPAESAISRVVISSEAVGNLFLPDDPLRFTIEVAARRPLPETTLTCEVRDYKNVSHGRQPLSLKLAEWKTGHFRYEAELEWPRDAIEVGRFYRLHVAEPFQQYSGFARLPEAVTRRHPPADVPFTIRNWDGRLTPYFYLADRIGIRQIGLWGGWKPEAPYNPQLPGIDIVEKLGMRWLSGTPGAQVERGSGDWTETALRDGMREFCLRYKDRGLQMIALGNEPHGGEAEIRRNVAAYKALYEGVKSADSGIQVLATSVEPNEGYFKAGYHRYCDAYDFHIYETPEKVQKQMRDYRALMEKYDAVKPIHSTELGLNSQGLSRERVAIDMVKKTCVFFGEGGASMSWFTIMYPDADGDQRGSFGQAHCVFDSAYNQYNPKLDAITYYHLVNGLCVKRFCELRNWDDITAYRFADATDQQFVAIWSDTPKTVTLPLRGVTELRTTQIDGQHRHLHAVDGVFTLPLGASPVMLEYQQSDAGLPETLR